MIIKTRKHDTQIITVGIPKSLWYLMAFSLWFAGEIIFRSTLEYINETPLILYERRVTVIVTVMLLVQVALFQKYTRTELVVIALLTLVIAVATYNSGQNYLAAAWLFIVASRNIKPSAIAKLSLFWLSIGIPFVIMLNKLNIIRDHIIFRGGIMRHSYGFSHPNQLGLRIFQWILCFSFVFWKKMNIFYFAVIAAVGYWMHVVTDSQTASICVAAYLVLTILLKIIEKRKAGILASFAVILRLGSLFIGLFSIFFTRFNIRRIPILAKVDSFISSRYYWANMVYRRFGATAWGQSFSTAAVENGIMLIRKKMYLDNAYATLWLRFGTVFFFIFVIGYYFLMKRFEKNALVLIILFVFSVYGIMESGLIQLTNNIFLLLFAELLFFKEREKEADEIVQLDSREQVV